MATTIVFCSEVLLNCGSQSDRKIWMEKIQAQNTNLTSHHHHDTSSGSTLSVPRGHQRQASIGGEGNANYGLVLSVIKVGISVNAG